MATFGEIVYSVLDLLKEHSDDAFYTEEHILFLAKQMRALLLERKYRMTRNGVFANMSEENKQQLCVELEPATMLPSGCGGDWLRSTAEIPQLLSTSTGVTCTGHDMLQSVVTFIPMERMPYVGYNKWLKNIVYAARSNDGHLYLSGRNPQFLHLQKVGLTGVFSDPEEAAKLSHEACENGGMCDIMTQTFPLESSLVPSCVELIVQEIAGPRYAPEDKSNNAKDDLGEVAAASSRAARPVENTRSRREREAEQYGE